MFQIPELVDEFSLRSSRCTEQICPSSDLSDGIRISVLVSEINLSIN